MTFQYPVVLDLTDVPVLVVGGGPVALSKARGLADAGAALTVVAPVVHPDFDDIEALYHLREYEASDLDGIQLVVTATSDPEVNAEVSAAARAAGVFVNSADDPANCTFILPAVARRGRLIAAVSTGGGSPALAQHLRDRIARDVLTERAAVAADQLAAERDAIHVAGGSTEGLDWHGRVRDLLA